MMEGVRRGGDRQVLHERVRIHSQAAADALKRGEMENDLLDRIAADRLFAVDRATLKKLANPEDYIGLARQQTERFLTEEIDPIIASHSTDVFKGAAEVRV
jgi:adenylosuccinate lyase